MPGNYEQQNFPPPFSDNLDSIVFLEHYGGHARVSFFKDALNRNLPELPDGTRQGLINLPGDPESGDPPDALVLTYNEQEGTCTARHLDDGPERPPVYTYRIDERHGLITRQDYGGRIEEVDWNRIWSLVAYLGDPRPELIGMAQRVMGDSSATNIEVGDVAWILDVHTQKLAIQPMTRSLGQIAMSKLHQRVSSMERKMAGYLGDLEKYAHEALNACHTDYMIYTRRWLGSQCFLGIVRDRESERLTAVTYADSDPNSYHLRSVTVGPRILQVAESVYQPFAEDEREVLLVRQADSRLTYPIKELRRLVGWAWKDRPTLS